MQFLPITQPFTLISNSYNDSSMRNSISTLSKWHLFPNPYFLPFVLGMRFCFRQLPSRTPFGQSQLICPHVMIQRPNLMLASTHFRNAFISTSCGLHPTPYHPMSRYKFTYQTLHLRDQRYVMLKQVTPENAWIAHKHVWLLFTCYTFVGLDSIYRTWFHCQTMQYSSLLLKKCVYSNKCGINVIDTRCGTLLRPWYKSTTVILDNTSVS